MHLELREWIGYGLYAGVCGLAFVVGGRPERMAAGMLIAVQLATTLLQPSLTRMGDLAPGLFLLDLAFFGALASLLLGYRRAWLVWAVAFQTLAVMTHVARWLAPGVGGWGYTTADVLWGYGVLAALLTAIWRRLRAWLGLTATSGGDGRDRQPDG